MVFLEVLGVAPPDEARKATHHVFIVASKYLLIQLPMSLLILKSKGILYGRSSQSFQITPGNLQQFF